jgi:YihY family inner membrane protein
MTTEKIKSSVYLTSVILTESVRSFLRNNNFEMSAALATYGFFALMPLFFLLAYFSGNYGLFSDSLMSAVENLVLHLFPRPDKVSFHTYQFLTEHRVTWGAIGFVMVFVSMMSLVDTLRTAFLKILRIEQEISVIRTQARNILGTCTLLILSLCLLAAEMGYALLAERFLLSSPLTRTVADIASSLAVASLCMITLYLAFLPVRLKVHQVLVASLVTAALLIAMRDIFSMFLRFNPDYGITFGSLKTLFIMIIWVYYCFLVILFGSEIVVNITRKDVLLLRRLFSGENASHKTPAFLMKKFMQHFGTGDVLFAEGDAGTSMYFVISGAVEISRHGQFIRVMKQGDYFGEMSMLLNSPRTATATIADPQTELIRISQANFDTILRENPTIVFSILKEMTLRLKVTNEAI